MDENRDYTLEQINKLIAISYKEIEDLTRQKMMLLTPHESINVCKSIARLMEDIRKLLRLRLRIEKDVKQASIQKKAEMP